MAAHSSILAWRIPMDREAWRATVHVILKSQTWLCWAFFAARGLSLVVVSRGCSLWWCPGFSLWQLFCYGAWALSVWASAAAALRFSSWGSWALDRGFSLVTLQHVESSQTRDQTQTTGRQILNHWTAREVLGFLLVILFIYFCLHQVFIAARGLF